MLEELVVDVTSINWSDNIICQFIGDYYFLNNFYQSIIVLKLLCNNDYKPIKFNNAETAYQYGKAYFAKDDIGRKNILNTMSPKDAKFAGHNVIFKNKNDFILWENKKFQWMYKVIEEKFIQNVELQIKLVQTYPKLLINGNTWDETYWGYSLIGLNGFNNLGIILMMIRDRIIHNYFTNLINL